MDYASLKLKEAREIQLTKAAEGTFYNIKRDEYGRYYMMPCTRMNYVQGYPPIAPAFKRRPGFWESIFND